MAYQTPNVVKEIYIPFDYMEDDGISLDEYKAKYGIDLRDFFSFDATGIHLKNNIFAKFYVVYRGLVSPLEVVEDEEGNDVVVLHKKLLIDFSEVSAVQCNVISAIKWADDESLLYYAEL